MKKMLATLKVYSMNGEEEILKVELDTTHHKVANLMTALKEKAREEYFKKHGDYPQDNIDLIDWHVEESPP